MYRLLDRCKIAKGMVNKINHIATKHDHICLATVAILKWYAMCVNIQSFETMRRF